MHDTTNAIHWLRDWDEAFVQARRANTPVLVVAKDPVSCLGCEQLEEYTLSDSAVQAAISERFVPLQVHPREPAMRALRVLWFPTTVIFDKRGIEHYRAINPLPPADYLDLLAIGESLARMRSAEYVEAIDRLEGVVARSPEGPLRPEALFYLGIAWYFRERRKTGARDRIWRELTEQYPDSPWAYRVPWRLDEAMGLPGRSWNVMTP